MVKKVLTHRPFSSVRSDHGDDGFSGFDEIHSVGRIALLHDDGSVIKGLGDQSVGQVHSLVRLKG